MNRINDVRLYSFSNDDRLFLDANIWLSVYGPLAYNRRRRARYYSKALRDIRNSDCEVFLDALVLSEFINNMARWEYGQSSPKPSTFKIFRQSSAFKAIAENIVNNVRRIVSQCRRCESNFTGVDIQSLLTEFEKGDSDFNDQMISEICKHKGLTLITDDADFKGSDLTILTANNRLLPS